MARISLTLEASFVFGKSKLGIITTWLLLKLGVPVGWLIRVKVKR